MKYILLNLLDSPIKEYQQQLVQEVAQRFNVHFTEEQGLPSHFTLKYSFETGDIEEVEEILKKFCASHHKQPIIVDGFGNFRKEVLYLNLNLLKAAQETFFELIAVLRNITWMQWNENDGENLHLHSTIAQKCENKFNEISKYLEVKEQKFDTYFDNITILKQVGVTKNGISKWEVYKTFKLLD